MKNMFFLLLLSVTFSLQAKVNWNPYLLDQARFVHMSKSDQRNVLIKTMELMVEMETKYKLEVKTSGFSQERFEKFVKALNHFKSFLISEAVAADYNKMGTDFKTLIEKLGKDACIYGGWVSQTVTVGGHSFCRHPSQATNKDVKAAYNAASGACKGPSKISCNPMIFGYQKSEGEKVFCIPTGAVSPTQNKSHNVSYECMRAALNDKGSATQDSREKRLEIMTKTMSSPENKKGFESIHKVVFQTCVCGQSTMNADYVDYLRPHRTCFGMMNTLRAMKTEDCSALNKTISEGDKEFAEKWSKFFVDKDAQALPVPQTRNPTEFDLEYKKLIDNDAVKNFCGIPANAPAPLVAAPAPATPEAQSPKGGKEFVCEAKCEANDKDEVACSIGKIGWNTTVKDAEPKFEEIAEATLKKDQEIKSDATTLTVVLKDGSEQACKISLPEDEKSCSIAITDDEKTDHSKALLTLVNVDDKEVKEIKWEKGESTKTTPKEAIFPTLKEGDVVKATVTLNDSKSLACEGKKETVPPASEVKKAYTISAAVTQDLANTAKIKATVKDDDGKETKLPDGHQILWTREGTGADEIKTLLEKKGDDKDKDKKKSKSALEEMAEASGEKEDDKAPDKIDKEKKKEVKKEEGEFSRGSVDEVLEVRVRSTYKTCASLLDNKGATVAGPSCADVQPLMITPMPGGNFGGGGGGSAPPPMNPGFNTGVRGIQ